MGVNSLVNSNIYDTVFRKGMKLGFYTEELSGNKTITVDYPPVLILDPANATRDVTLPAEASSVGLSFYIFNNGSGSEILVIKDDGGTTIITLDFPDNGWVFCDGIKWRGIVSKGIT